MHKDIANNHMIARDKQMEKNYKVNILDINTLVNNNSEY